jgi:predicted GIY-YIG superfamily endonuclease
MAEHHRGKVHSTHRFGQPLELIAAKEMLNIDSARELERKLKAKKNPKVAIYLLGEQID